MNGAGDEARIAGARGNRIVASRSPRPSTRTPGFGSVLNDVMPRAYFSNPNSNY